MRLRPSIFAALLLVSAVTLRAEDAPKQDAPKDPVPPYVLKKRSAFEASADGTRAPFWPIGWVKRVKAGTTVQVQEVVAPKVTLDEKSFRVTSILIGSGTTPSLAVINGRAYSEGEYIRMPKAAGGSSIRVRVQRISDGTVVLQNADQRLVASLQRMELNNKRPEELLLDPDR